MNKDDKTEPESSGQPSSEGKDKQDFASAKRKLPFQGKQNKRNKIASHQANKQQKNQRHGGTEFEKQQLPNHMSIPARYTVHSLYTSNLGVETFVPIIYNAMIAKDFRLERIMSVHQLQYVTNLAILNRCHLTSIRYGGVIPEQASMLKNVASGIQLPDIICRYVESFGHYTTLSGVNVIPRIMGTFREQYPLNQHIMLDPDRLLVNQDGSLRPVPDNPWHIDEPWIIRYNQSTLRAQRSGLQFRNVDNSTLVGNQFMVSSYSRNRDRYLVAYSSEKTLEPEAQLSACYLARNRANIQDWLGGSHHLITDDFLTTAFSDGMFVSEICQKSFTPVPFGTR